MVRAQQRTRAPPIEQVLHVPADVEPPASAVARAARWTGLWCACVWGAALLGGLLGAGRVPWQESVVWSVLSAMVVARSSQVVVRRVLGWALAPTSIELGMQDPQATRRRLGRVLGRYGYRESRHSLHRDRYEPRRLRSLLPPLAVAWSGPGAIVTGPRWLVRVAARLAVG